jgi:RNA polymerase sigma factor for flagellar operon FliA
MTAEFTGDPAVAARVSELTADIMPQARAEAYKVWQRAPHALELDELHAIALTGLAQAAARWERTCAEKGRDPEAWEYFPAFCLARMRGAMLDSLRSQDWVTRSDRTRAKAIRDAGQDRGASAAELAAATGMTVAEVRSTMAAVSARPVSMDAEPHDVADEADVESQAVVSEVLEAASAATRTLPPEVQVLLALRYYAGRTVAAAGAALGMEPGEAARAHTAAILQIHDAMLRAVV